MDDAEDEATPLPDPSVRMRPGAAGTPLTLADGREWLLADGGLGNGLDALRDRWFDEAVTRGSVPYPVLYAVAYVLLAANYHPLGDDEFQALVAGVDPDAVAAGCRVALFGDDDAPESNGYSAWARASFLVNGVDPDKVPVALHRPALAILVETGRTPPVDDFVASIRRKAGWDVIRALAKKPGE